MKIIAKAAKGAEYLYNAQSAHGVAQARARKVCDVLNAASYQLKEGETWHVYDVWVYDDAYFYAQDKRFVLRANGQLIERR